MPTARPIAREGSDQHIASQIAQGVEQIAQMAEGKHSASQSTEQSAHALRDLATTLEQALGRFRAV
ncbi:hypothetical protein ACCAA_370026 [Candidatus Accumulibacter aalborgensis]|uniref:Methyl-accepting chemotaxis sensory transducer n=1 Tax=Candidatus Accumulibacter aalborgensis TaxID=1860102 RepID=A0A1A8XR47_9PROT|nr:hypothetical protein ACCAA_370026 [Candidatus Accumulibacter aalborgensis]